MSNTNDTSPDNVPALPDQAATLRAELDAARFRLQVIVDEEWGPYPIMSMDDLLDELERQVGRQRVAAAMMARQQDMLAEAAKATGEIDD